MQRSLSPKFAVIFCWKARRRSREPDRRPSVNEARIAPEPTSDPLPLSRLDLREVQRGRSGVRFGNRTTTRAARAAWTRVFAS
jgi:hypothetical protein